MITYKLKDGSEVQFEQQVSGKAIAEKNINVSC